MYSITELKTGTYIELEGEPYQVIDYQHSKQARQGGVMRTTLKNLLTGNVVERSFKGADKIPPAEVGYFKAQYLYKEGDNYSFMNNETYEQFELTTAQVAESAPFLVEGANVDVQQFREKPINLKLPPSLVFTVVETVPGLKGDNATGGTKPATLETGMVVSVPLFIKEGEKIKVDTRTHAYLERFND
jgi:elongation factor P